VFIADRGDVGRRLDLVLRRHLTDLPRATRTRVQGWIESGRVSVNGRAVVRVAARAAMDDTIEVQLPDEQPRTPVLPEEGTLACLYEDDHLLVVDKPAGLVSHPTYKHQSGSLLNHLLWHARDWPAGRRPSLVGRLDKQTSGAVLIAKTTDMHAALQRTLMSAFSEKSYLAAVFGPVHPERGTIDLPLCADPADRRLVIVSPEGRPSMTRYERLDAVDAAGCAVALARCQLVTGRMHQVRVHMAARGWPLIGDPKYGAPRWESCADVSRQAALAAFPRQALHAWRLAFEHPVTRERVEVEAPVPDDMRHLLQACGLRAPASATLPA
jgi:23S rRNA pseudouridine1911/1915/1917 synthase